MTLDLMEIQTEDMKMTKKFDSLNDTFEISSDVISSEISKVETVSEQIKSSSVENNDINKDYEYTRGNLYSLIEKGQEAINGILELAQESEMPRAYEVAGQLIKNVADATDKLMDLQKKLKDIDESKNTKSPTKAHISNQKQLADFLSKQY